MKIFTVLMLFVVLFLMSSCGDGAQLRQGTVCNCAEKEKVAEWISENMKASNNMSDEEMEDVIYQLEKTGIKLHCHSKMITVNRQGDVIWELTKLDSCETLYPHIY